jgi:hypothetical protein
MGTPGETDTRLTTLERKQGETATAQEKMQLQLNRQEERFAQTLDILVDHSDAISYLTKYLMHFTLESLEHALMISSATTKFAGFLKLPEETSSMNLYIDAAFTAVAAVFPAVRLLKLLDGINKEAAVALAVAKLSKTGPSVAGAIMAVPKAGEIADVVKKANDTRMKALAALKSDPATTAVAELAKLDNSDATIMYFAETSTRTAETFDKVANLIAEEFYQRIKNPEVKRKEDILSITKRILVMHEFPTPDELRQLGRTYLWEMIASYCKQNNNVVFVKQTGWGAYDGLQLRGLNGTQMKALMDMFGPTVRRGAYFRKPVFPAPNVFLAIIGINTVVEDTGRMPPR